MGPKSAVARTATSANGVPVLHTEQPVSKNRIGIDVYIHPV